MDEKTYLDELVDYPALIIEKLVQKPIILSLLANKQDATILDVMDDDGNWKYFFDYEYIPGTTQEVMSAICVDTDIVSVKTSATKTLELYISVLCAQDIMSLDRKQFKGMRGNRLNNLVRFVDHTLRLDRDFGIGRMALKNARTTTSGNANYAKKTLTYLIPDFNLNG